MNIDVLTIFPGLFDSFWEHGMIRQALLKERIRTTAVDLREFAEGRHRVTDDRPYGGGCGMVMKPEPLAAGIRALKQRTPASETILLTPQGQPFSQEVAADLAKCEGMILVCGRYEGIDERICDTFIDREISIGDYIMTGGEVAAMAVIEAVVRLIPGILGGAESAEKETFADNRVEHDHYTRPEAFEGRRVPGVLLSGHHGDIEKWRLEKSLMRTFLKRPDLMENRPLTKEEILILRRWCRDIERINEPRSEHCAGAPPGGEQGR